MGCPSGPRAADPLRQPSGAACFSLRAWWGAEATPARHPAHEASLPPPFQIVNLIEETGHFNVTNTTFDFDLFSLDETTVRKLQSYLEAVAT